jgi:hypothetical protein
VLEMLVHRALSSVIVCLRPIHPEGGGVVGRQKPILKTSKHASLVVQDEMEPRRSSHLCVPVNHWTKVERSNSGQDPQNVPARRLSLLPLRIRVQKKKRFKLKLSSYRFTKNTLSSLASPRVAAIS